MRTTISALAITAALLALRVGSAWAAALPQEGTPPIQTATTSLPWLGVLILLAPAVFMVWRSRKKKAADKITACGCLPVFDDDARPFAIPDDETGKPA